MLSNCLLNVTLGRVGLGATKPMGEDMGWVYDGHVLHVVVIKDETWLTRHK